jgi:hypothetical protein
MEIAMATLGWIGAILLLGGYAGVSFKKIAPTSRLYQFLNAAGSGSLFVNTMYHHAYPASSLNLIWAVIAAVALVRRPAA